MKLNFEVYDASLFGCQTDFDAKQLNALLKENAPKLLKNLQSKKLSEPQIKSKVSKIEMWVRHSLTIDQKIPYNYASIRVYFCYSDYGINIFI